jgi:hypothetical protein
LVCEANDARTASVDLSSMYGSPLFARAIIAEKHGLVNWCTRRVLTKDFRLW